jgi:hypothetical protein
MLWFRKGAKPAQVPVPADGIAPQPLPVAFDAQRFRVHYGALVAAAEAGGGIETHLAALGAKRDACAAALARAAGAGLALEEIERLLGYAFTARRRLYPALAALGAERVSALVARLAAGPGRFVERLQAFVDAMPGAVSADREALRAAARLRRATWDFAAELAHYGDPERYPLMTRWVWDAATQSGALREFVRGADAMREIPFTNEPGTFEAARRWLAGELAGAGHYRDIPLWVDLVQAQAYLGYVRSVAEGSLGGDFGRGTPPHEQLAKLLGIDGGPHGRPRVKKAA